jgi:hypothetical protein
MMAAAVAHESQERSAGIVSRTRTIGLSSVAIDARGRSPM